VEASEIVAVLGNFGDGNPENLHVGKLHFDRGIEDFCGF
jgi:hypothetical protein